MMGSGGSPKENSMAVLSSPHASGRIDWKQNKSRVDLAAVATNLLGPPLKRSGCRLLWRCPFHDDHDPSFQVDPNRGTWKCWPCGIGGDAAELVMKIRGVVFSEAIKVVAEISGILTPSERSGSPPPR